jgi:hypothetical protein
VNRALRFTLLGLTLVVLFAVTWLSLPGSVPFFGLYGERETQYGSAGHYNAGEYQPASST